LQKIKLHLKQRAAGAVYLFSLCTGQQNVLTTPVASHTSTAESTFSSTEQK